MGHPPNIVLCPQTDERNFPSWSPDATRGQSGYKYPKMLTRPAVAADIDEHRKRSMRIDRATREEYYETRPPSLGEPLPVLSTPELVNQGYAKAVGAHIEVNSPEEEAEIKAILGLAEPQAVQEPEVFAVKLPGRPVTPAEEGEELLRLKAENEQLEAELTRREQLLKRLNDTPTEPPPRRTRKRKSE